MITFLGMGVVAVWFSVEAKKTGKSAVLWFSVGLLLYLFMGFIFLVVSERFILRDISVEDAFSVRWGKVLLELVSMILILGTGFLIQNRFLKPQGLRRRTEITKKAAL
ncbi:MAG TPA: hypothetical protein VHO03_20535 [Ignavibacteriales bacterium]|nr:hypothetical protein [Ignavibacteriales bacterium]